MRFNPYKLNSIEADPGKDWAAALGNRASLEKEIAVLAKKSGETIFFHHYVEDPLGAPVILLECRDAFLEKIKNIPGFSTTTPLPDDIKTIRRTDMPSIEPPPSMKTPKNKPPKP